MFKKSSTWIIVLIALTVTGCHKVFGGGWFYGEGGEKVTFGFEVQCHDNEEGLGVYVGQFQYDDKTNGVRFHGDINAPFQDSCEEIVENNSEHLNQAIFAGECLSKPGNVSGHFNVVVQDNETPGSLGAGDVISVFASCTPPDVTDYFNVGFLGAGNVMSIKHRN